MKIKESKKSQSKHSHYKITAKFVKISKNQFLSVCITNSLVCCQYTGHQCYNSFQVIVVCVLGMCQEYLMPFIDRAEDKVPYSLQTRRLILSQRNISATVNKKILFIRELNRFRLLFNGLLHFFPFGFHSSRKSGNVNPSIAVPNEISTHSIKEKKK